MAQGHFYIYIFWTPKKLYTQATILVTTVHCDVLNSVNGNHDDATFPKVLIGSRAHPASYPEGTAEFFPDDKVVRV
jgi:hypothetical protein